MCVNELRRWGFPNMKVSDLDYPDYSSLQKANQQLLNQALDDLLKGL